MARGLVSIFAVGGPSTQHPAPSPGIITIRHLGSLQRHEGLSANVHLDSPVFGHR